MDTTPPELTNKTNSPLPIQLKAFAAELWRKVELTRREPQDGIEQRLLYGGTILRWHSV